MSLSVLKLRKLRLLCKTRAHLSVNLYKIYSTNYKNYFDFGDPTLIPVQSSLVTSELQKLFWTSGSSYSHPQAVTKVTYSLAWLPEAIPLLTTSRTPSDGRLQSLIITSESRETMIALDLNLDTPIGYRFDNYYNWVDCCYFLQAWNKIVIQLVQSPKLGYVVVRKGRIKSPKPP